MAQSPEAETFLNRICALPSGPGTAVLHEVFQQSIEDETVLRSMWAQDKLNPRIQNPLVGLVNVFEAPVNIRKIRARVGSDDSRYVMPLDNASRRKDGEASMVDNLEAFKSNWAVFTENSLSQMSAMHWNNVVAAGGSVLACLTPPPESTQGSNRMKRKYYHVMAFPSSDVDLFLWGLNSEEAERKIVDIYNAIQDSVPYEVTCIRTKHTISIHSQYPYRPIQIVLRLYSSPAEILAGFDIDAACYAYDGTNVWANPRAITAIMRQCNTIDMTRRSPSYEVRLAKYASRGFEVYVPTLNRDGIDLTIYELNILHTHGLARLLVLERLQHRFDSLSALCRLHKMPKRSSEHVDPDVMSISSYDVSSLYIPYGPKWDAKKVEGVIRKMDNALNSKFNLEVKNRRLHRHPAFVAKTARQCMEDGCKRCPFPKDSVEQKLQNEDDKRYVRGRITFIGENPGQQLSSVSFNPVNDREWSEQVYVYKHTELFREILFGNRERVKDIIAGHEKAQTIPSSIHTINQLDHLGRTPLITAVLARQTDIAIDLIDAGAKISFRMPDGRTALHCAAQTGLHSVLIELLNTSRRNSASRNGGNGDERDEEDVLDIEAPDWGAGLSPLAFAIVFSPLALIDTLIAEDATSNIAPVTLIRYRMQMDGNDSCASRKIAERFGVEMYL